LGICNGFQTLVNLGLLPGFDHDYQTRSVALVNNDCGNFRNDWVRLKVNAGTPCIFTQGLDSFELPIRHGEGKFYADHPVLDRLEQNNQVALRYASKDGSPAQGEFPFNPNGSIRDIAGICDSTGRVFGLMPHPEAYNHWTNHPDWTLQKRRQQPGDLASETTAGIRIFQNAVKYLRNG
ncbi:MAG: phosphoribosylformylglycinamidine synthase subunit PurQ, partial [Desulfobacterales bacterium]|nr:phosphoribosylformylglycinamidine synthase subunit PurQ [Desulfobacterales bacterium]